MISSHRQAEPDDRISAVCPGTIDTPMVTDMLAARVLFRRSVASSRYQFSTLRAPLPPEMTSRQAPVIATWSIPTSDDVNRH